MGESERSQQWEPPIVLSAGVPHEDDDVPVAQLLAIEEALLSLTRASLAHGRRLALPADDVVAPLVVEIAAEYAAPPQAEAERVDKPLVQILLTEGGNERLVEALAELDYVQTIALEPPREERAGRQPLSAEAVRQVEPFAAVLLGGARESLEDLPALSENDVPVQVIGPTLSGALREYPELRDNDVVEQMLEEIGWKVESGDERRGVDTELHVPYSYVMQRLVEKWGSDPRR